jgi:hypothetical protein
MPTWKEVLERKDLIGADLESVENNFAFRGPIESITIVGESVIFKSPWCARLDTASGRWIKNDITSLSVNMRFAIPQDIGHGRIFFLLPYLGHATIFPAGDGSLDPAVVVGLTLSDS